MSKQLYPSSSVCARQGSRSLLLTDLHLAQKEGFCFGVKLVRGAYMDKERKLAKEEGREDPVHQSWEDTNDRWTRDGKTGSLKLSLKVPYLPIFESLLFI